MEIKVKLQVITIKDENTGELFTVKTLRSAKDITEYVQEIERDQAVNIVEQEVWKVINKEE